VVPRRCGCGAGRRGVLTGLGASALGLAVPGRAPAEVPASLDELFDTFYGLNQPEAVRFPRRRLEKVFSVLLMRSGYASLDALDFFPVDRFQVQFWKLRASQQEAYNNLYDPLKMTVGDLADPLYFDFISFSQWATVDRCIRDAQAEFDEPCETCGGDEVVIRHIVRPEGYGDPSVLAQAFEDEVGGRVYRGLRDGFNETQFGAPKAPGKGAGAEGVRAAVAGLVGVMAKNGFCISTTVEVVPPDRMTEPGAAMQLLVRCQGPSMLWGISALDFRRSMVVNRYDALTVGAMLREGGWDASYKYRRTDAFTEALWTLK